MCAWLARRTCCTLAQGRGGSATHGEGPRREGLGLVLPPSLGVIRGCRCLLLLVYVRQLHNARAVASHRSAVGTCTVAVNAESCEVRYAERRDAWARRGTDVSGWGAANSSVVREMRGEGEGLPVTGLKLLVSGFALQTGENRRQSGCAVSWRELGQRPWAPVLQADG